MPSAHFGFGWGSGGDQGDGRQTRPARLPHAALRNEYVDQGAEFYEAQRRKQQVIHLNRKAAQLGLEIIEVAAAAQNHDWEFLTGVPGEKFYDNNPSEIAQHHGFH
jgi:hypothetical protein